jgi:uncharacterized membrane protein YjgN (DUF898 family)
MHQHRPALLQTCAATYRSDHINNILNGMYLCLVYGALYRLVDTIVPGVEGLEYAHWTGLPLVFVLGYSLRYVARWGSSSNAYLSGNSATGMSR